MIDNSSITVLLFGYLFLLLGEKYSSEGSSSIPFLELLLHENLPYDKRNLAENNLSKLVGIL